MTSRRNVLKGFMAAPAAGVALGASAAKIRQIDIFHHSHNDVGYTDLPSLCRELQVRFLGAALDACRNNPAFRWTAESLMVVDDWWRAAPPASREQLLSVVRRGQMDAMALPLNQAPFLNADQWRQAMHWIPETLWRDLNPRVAMQSDVNGFPRAGAMHLLDRGVRRLVMGINADSGGPPFYRPSAFWWKMPDGRKMFVWLGYHYGVAFGFFEAKNWQARQPRAASTTGRPAREGDFLKTDEESLRQCHAQLLGRLKGLEKENYPYERLILSYTGQWRYDNDAPFPPLPKFIAAWNRLGLEPKLRLTTVTEAVLDMEKIAGPSARTLEGEWTDWWANGDASGPREVAASRQAKRYLAMATSPLWGEMTPRAKRAAEAILKDLCLFDEHTWGANDSITHPAGFQTIGQYTEKSLTAYRPMGHAEFLLGQRVRTKLEGREPGLHVVNTARAPFTGWAQFEYDALHGKFDSVREGKRGAIPLEKAEAPYVRFWVQDLAPSATRVFEPLAGAATAVVEPAPEIELDAQGWPVQARWPGMTQPLFAAGTGGFTAVVLEPPADRRTITRLHANPDAAARARIREQALRRVDADPGTAKREDSAHTVVFTQPLSHPRLARASRTLEIWKSEPRARLTLRFDRISSTAPEVLFLHFAFPVPGVLPRFSNGGVPFTPYTDQLEGTCRDYFAIDGWAHYRAPEGHWLWVSRDAPLVAVGGPHTLERHTAVPDETHRLSAMVFDNSWHTNFVADSHGEMEFQFDLAWRASLDDAAAVADALVTEPVVFLSWARKESPEIMHHVFRT